MTATNSNCHPDFPPLPLHVEGARVLIRPSTRDDIPYLKQWWNDPEVTGPGGNVDGMHYDDDDMEDWFRRYVDERECRTHFVICLRDAGQTPIGEFYIATDDRPFCVEFALILGATEYWGQGYASEALSAYAAALFDSGQCGAMRMDTRVDNQRGISMCERAGFTVEHVWANGQFQTMILTEEAFRQRLS